MPSSMKKPCPVPGCGELLQAGACPVHAKQAEEARGTPEQRGYGRKHRELRERWKPIVEAGGCICRRCRKPIAPDAKWDLGHDDDDRTKYTGPEHAGCNRRAGGQSVRNRGNRR